MKKLLVVVDMVNGFINFGNLADKKINGITGRVEGLIKEALQSKTDIVAFRDCHEKDDIEFKTFPEHCLKGSLESELIPELKKYEPYMTIIDKPTTNGFITEQFQEYIKSAEFDEIVVCGCCTDICVQNFCESLQEYIMANHKNTVVVVYEDSVATFDGVNHNAADVQKKSLKEMQDKGIKVVYTDEHINGEDDENCEC